MVSLPDKIKKIDQSFAMEHKEGAKGAKQIGILLDLHA